MAIVKPNVNDIWASAGDVTEPSQAKKLLGWIAEIPTFQVFNFVLNRQDEYNAYINGNGLGGWDTDTEYPVKGLVRGSDGKWYEALVEQAGNDPVGDIVNWKLWFTSYAELKSGRRNLIVDGRMDFWFEGTSQTTDGYGSLTMVQTIAQGTTFSITQQNLVRGVDLPTISTADFFIRTAVTSVVGASNRARKIFIIEDVGTLAGKKGVFSFHAKTDSNQNISIEGLQIFGSGGSSTVTGISPTKIQTTGTFTRYDVTLDFPSISGKTIGEGDHIEIYVWYDAGSDFDSRTDSLGHQSGTFDIAAVQLEEGEVATKFEEEGQQEAIARVNRYYLDVKSFGLSGHLSLTTISDRFSFGLPEEMRVPPALSIGTLSLVINVTAVLTATNTKSLVAFRTVPRPAAGDFRAQFDFTADSRL